MIEWEYYFERTPTEKSSLVSNSKSSSLLDRVLLRTKQACRSIGVALLREVK